MKGAVFWGGFFFFFWEDVIPLWSVSKKKHVILEGSSFFLAVSKPKQQKAENKAALCV